jgi:hypothetical protein
MTIIIDGSTGISSIGTLTGVTSISSASASTPTIMNDSGGTQIGTLCRAWVNFNGTGTVAIRASFNVSSITDNGTGDYTVNMTNALSDINYSISGSSGTAGVGAGVIYSTTYQQAPTTTTFRAAITTNAGSNVDNAYVYFQVFR